MRNFCGLYNQCIYARILCILVVFFFSLNFVKAQNKKIDSLLILLANDRKDTTKINHLNVLSREYTINLEYDNGLKYANKALDLANFLQVENRIGWPKGIAAAYNNIGLIYYYQGNYPEALKKHFAALIIWVEIKNKKGIGNSYNNIGNVFWSQGNYQEALKYHNTSLQIREGIADKKGIAMSYNNIGLIYWDQGNYTEALKNHHASLKIKEEIQDKHGIAMSYNNMGLIYQSQADYPNAIKSHLNSLKINHYCPLKK